MTAKKADRGTEVARELAGMDDRIAACRAWGHEWPSRKLRPGKPLPKGFSPRKQRDGSVLITESCASGCGKTRQYLTLPGGGYDTDATRRYGNPRNWVVVPADLNITRRHIQAEVFRRAWETIEAVAQLPEQEDGDA